MKTHDLHIFLESEFGSGLKCENRADGNAYYWEDTRRAPASTRLLRITETDPGEIVEIKLAQSSIAKRKSVFLPLPASREQIAAAVRAELSFLPSK